MMAAMEALVGELRRVEWKESRNHGLLWEKKNGRGMAFGYERRRWEETKRRGDLGHKIG